MKVLSYILFTLVLISCGTDSSHFSIDGHLLNMNQGDFYVYSPDGLTDAIDTIHVVGGRFSYETECQTPGTLVIVFPNYSELPVFAEPGESVDLEGDAHKLKEMKVTGTDANKLMSSFRENTINASPPEIRHLVELFVGDHPESIVSSYLVRHYFIVCQNPDFKAAEKLYDKMIKAQPDNGLLKLLASQIKAQSRTTVGSMLPPFHATDINGNTLTEKDYLHGLCLIWVWASWEYESEGTLVYLNNLPDGKVKLLGLSVDASVKDCRNCLEREKIHCPIVCDGQMFDNKIFKDLGLNVVPANILVQDGRIIARDLTTQQIREKFNQ